MNLLELMKRILKQKKCRVCKTLFTPRSSTQIVCGYEHAIAYAALQKTKALNQDIRRRKVELKTRQQWLKEVQTEFNKFIRLRDKNEPCISCQRFHKGQYHAGHYRSVGAAPQLRFNELNCHKQCSVCNNHLSGNAIEYRKNLIKRIGIRHTESLEADNTPRHYTIDDLKELKLFYRNRWKELEHE